MNTEDINKLLDLGREKCGSDYAMAKHIETSRATLSDWRKGRKKMPAADVALVANIAGLDAVAWCARAVAEGYTNRKGDLIRAALKKALEATGAATVLFGTVALEFTQCILC